MMCPSSIRVASPADAAAVVEFLRELRAERLPTLFRHDSTPTVEEETEFLRRICESANSIFLLALDRDSVVGNLELVGALHFQVRHVGRLGMSVLSEWRGRGVGTSLIRTAIDWASTAGIRRIELEVVENNPRALRLYERMGFVQECRRREAFLLGELYLDVIQMSRAVPANAT